MAVGGRIKSALRPQNRNRALILAGGAARGAYQIGVWKHLQEMGWKPDLICGNSVGALNAAAIGSGMELDEIIRIWRTVNHRRVYRVSLWRQFLALITRRYTPLVDTGPLRELVNELLDVRKLRKSRVEIIITAVNIVRSQLKFFNHEVIDEEHLMASSAIPLFFPWQEINGEPHWDGVTMANTPILPALERGAKEVIVVLLSPVGGMRMKLPRNRAEAVERVMELALNGSYESFMSHLAWMHKAKAGKGVLQNLLARRTLTLGDVRIVTVAPERMLGLGSLFNFSPRQHDLLMHEGYMDARNQLADYFGRED